MVRSTFRLIGGRRGLILSLILFALVALSSAYYVIRQATAIQIGPEHRIAFVSQQAGAHHAGIQQAGGEEIYAIAADGSAQTRLTYNDRPKTASGPVRRRLEHWFPNLELLNPPAVFDGDPAWSPDGTQLAYVSGEWFLEGDRYTHAGDLYVLGPDSPRPVRLTRDMRIEGEPVWSPDGTQLAFVARKKNRRTLYTIQVDGTGLSALSPDLNILGAPAWSPGAQIAFVAWQSGEDGLYIVRPDGVQRTRLIVRTPETFAHTPAWSPDGKQIAFFSCAQAGQCEIHVVSVTGRDRRPITGILAGGQHILLNWSPDGSKLAFTAWHRDRNFELWVVNANGSDLRRLATHVAEDLHPTWAPDDTRIAFVSSRAGGWDLYVVNVDGSDLTRLTFDGHVKFSPKWRPRVP